MTFTPWTLLIDVGIVSALLLFGKLVRARLSFVQRLFIPPSLLAGDFFPAPTERMSGVRQVFTSARETRSARSIPSRFWILSSQASAITF